MTERNTEFTQERAEKALDLLLRTDREEARLRGYYEMLQDLTKSVVGLEFDAMRSKGKGAEESKQLAYASQDYREHLEKVQKAGIEWREMLNQRKSAMTAIEMWRSINAGQRKGNI